MAEVQAFNDQLDSVSSDDSSLLTVEKRKTSSLKLCAEGGNPIGSLSDKLVTRKQYSQSNQQVHANTIDSLLSAFQFAIFYWNQRILSRVQQSESSIDIDNYFENGSNHEDDRSVEGKEECDKNCNNSEVPLTGTLKSILKKPDDVFDSTKRVKFTCFDEILGPDKVTLKFKNDNTSRGEELKPRLGTHISGEPTELRHLFDAKCQKIKPDFKVNGSNKCLFDHTSVFEPFHDSPLCDNDSIDKICESNLECSSSKNNNTTKVNSTDAWIIQENINVISDTMRELAYKKKMLEKKKHAQRWITFTSWFRTKKETVTGNSSVRHFESLSRVVGEPIVEI